MSAIVSSRSIAPIVLPHLEQKARLELFDERKVVGSLTLPIQRMADFGNSTHATVSAPEVR